MYFSFCQQGSVFAICFAKVSLYKSGFYQDVLCQIFDHLVTNYIRDLQYLFNMRARPNLHANKNRLGSCYYEYMLITDINLAPAKCDEFSPDNHYALFQFLSWCSQDNVKYVIICVLNVNWRVKYIETEEESAI